MNKCTAKLLLIFYLLLTMILVSLKQTYTFTKGIFGNDMRSSEYGIGLDLTQRGFVVHVIVFSLLAAVPFYFVKEYM